MSLYILLVMIIVFIISVIIIQVKKVKDNEAYVIERNKKFNRIVTSRTTFVIPLIEKVKSVVSLNKQTKECCMDIAISLDGKTIKNKNRFQFHVIDPYKAIYESEGINEKLEYLEITIFREIIRQIRFIKN